MPLLGIRDGVQAVISYGGLDEMQKRRETAGSWDENSSIKTRL